MGVHAQEQMAQFMRDHMTHDQRWIRRSIACQLLNTGGKDIDLDSPSIASHESDPEILTRKTERATHDSHKQFIGSGRGVAVVFPDDRDSSVAVDPFRSFLR